MILTRFARLPLILRVGDSILDKLDEIISEHNLVFPCKVVVSTPELDQLYSVQINRISEKRCLISNSTLPEAERLMQQLQKFPRETLLIAFGGGQVIDTVKYVATKLDMNYMSVPTALSNDGIYSPVAVLSDGHVRRRMGANVPLGIIIDLAIIKMAPADTLRSGIGDLISNQNALLDWELGRDKNKEIIDDFAYTLSLFSTQTVSKLSAEDFGKPAFISRVAYALVMSGLAMEIAGTTRPCSGAEHAISHAIDELFPARSTFHGLQVGAATPLMLQLHGQDTSAFRVFMNNVGMPIGLRELGFNDNEILSILTCARDIRNRFTILKTVTIDKRLLNSMEMY